MNHANIEDYDTIYNMFKLYRKDHFPHIRKDYIEGSLKKKRVILEDDVVIVYLKYQKRQRIGNCIVDKGDIAIKQILTSKKGSGNASKVLNRFLDTFQTNVWLCVREDNKRAIRFYEKNGFTQIGQVTWTERNRDLEGAIYHHVKSTINSFI